MDQSRSGITPTRPLLVNGEMLKREIQAANLGGGNKFEPQSPEQAQAVLTSQINNAVQDVRAMPDAVRASGHIYVEAKLLPNYLAASYFPVELLSQIGASPVGSRADIGQLQTSSKVETVQTRRIVFTVSDSGLHDLQRLITAGGRTRSEKEAFTQLREIEEITLPRELDLLRLPQDNDAIELQDSQTWEAVLHPLTSRLGEAIPIDSEILGKWIALVEGHGGSVNQDFIRQVGGLTFMPIHLKHSEIRDLARFNPLRVLRPMPAIRPRPRFGLRSGSRLIPPDQQLPVLESVSVAIFDGGVDQANINSRLFPISAVNLTTEKEEPDMLDHGTGVTGAALYGLVSPGETAPRPPLPVTSYRVLPAPSIPWDIEGYWVLDRIKDVLETGSHQIVNLSLGPELAVEDDQEPNRWTSELDQLAWEQDILFVVAAGNDGDQDQASGLHRVQIPADMVNGISVGACDNPAPQKPWSRASYSSMGPGRHGSRTQPIGVQFGGSDTRMFDVLRADGTFLEASGTSFAAPLTTHALSDLVTKLPRVNASVLRAFVTHFAERPNRHRKLRNEVGYGRQPISYSGVMECEENELHLLYIDEIERGDLLGYRLPIPLGITGSLELRITLAYASPVDPTQPTEYTSASLDLKLRPHERLHKYSSPKSERNREQVLDSSSEHARSLIEDGWRESQLPINKTLSEGEGGGSEHKLRESGKWETVRHYRLTLRPDEVSNPYFELSYLARRSGVLDNSPTKVPFALLVTAVDKSESSEMYDAIRSEFSSLRPAQRAGVRVRSGAAGKAHWF